MPEANAAPIAEKCALLQLPATSMSKLTKPGAQSRGHYSMLKSELVHTIAQQNPHLYHRDAERIIHTIFNEIVEAMVNGDKVELRGFGVFATKQRDARDGRNPRTGDRVAVKARRVPFFKAGKELRDKLNTGYQMN